MDATLKDLYSIWKVNCEEINFPALKNSIEVDVAIIGGGITGITCAQLLADAGKKVVVLEAWKIGEGTTGYSTGNLYGIVDERLYKVKSNFDEETARKLTQSRMEALNFIENNILKHRIDCDFQRTPWYLFTAAEEKLNVIEKEYKAYSQAGLGAALKDSLPVPVEVKKALEITQQAQFNPLRYVKKYALQISSPNCMVYEDTPVIDIDDDTHTLTTPGGNVKAKYIVHATHVVKGFSPVQALLGPYREYGIALKLDKGNYPPPGIFWNLEEGHHHSFRLYESKGEKYLIVVGAPHKVGHGHGDEGGFQDLAGFVQKHFGPGHIVHRWAGQHYRPADGVPYIGKRPFKDNQYFATGFSTDGLIYGTVAAQLIADSIKGVQNEYQAIYEANRIKPIASAGEFARENADVAWQMLKGLGKMLFGHPQVEDVPAGSGKIVEVENKKWAVYKDENNQPHIVSAICPHTGCVVNWNGTERSWDCPCHGSRFTPTGEVIEGPAISALRKME